MRKKGLGRLTLLRDKSVFGTALAFALVFGEHNTTRCQKSNSARTEKGGKRGRKERGKKEELGSNKRMGKGERTDGTKWKKEPMCWVCEA